MSKKKKQLAFGVPLLNAVSKRIAGHSVQRLLGFWVLWHAFGGMEPLLAAGLISRAGLYQNRKDFYAAFGVEVEDLFPEQAAAFRGPK